MRDAGRKLADRLHFLTWRRCDSAFSPVSISVSSAAFLALKASCVAVDRRQILEFR